MSVSHVPYLGHALSDATGSAGPAVAFAALIGFGLLLVIENTVVAHGRRGTRQARKPLAALVAAALVVVVAPAPGFAQSSPRPAGLPDLISDPPYIWYTRNVREPITDRQLRVMAFDGYIHNIGTGDLRVTGNPQLAGGMKQQVFDGSEWSDVASPTVRFETDDGHNHFHLIRAADYTLWDLGRQAPVTDASKVGFCLVDTEVREEGIEAAYLIDDYNYCEVDNPEATELTMGITSGWRDVYDANVTMQWVDVSEVEPGTYWVSAETDINDEIVESDETNNGIVFSDNSFAVDGYVARDLHVAPAEPFRLRTRTYGDPGRVAFVITEGPAHGTLDAPLGVDVLTDTLTYVPEPGFTGTDTFSYYAHDASSAYPRRPRVAVVTIEVPATSDREEPEPQAEATAAPDHRIDGDGTQQSRLHEPLTVQFTIDAEATEGRADDIARWYGANLPPGLIVDVDTGTVTGTPTSDGSFDSHVLAVGAGWSARLDVDWTVEPAPVPSLLDVNDISSAALKLVRYSLGIGSPDARYEATGLPEGTLLVENLPLLTGVPRELGDFRVEVREIVDGEVVDTVEFTWSIRPAPQPAFSS